MNDALLLILSLIGLLALYWVLFGQWKYNKMIREADAKREEKLAAGAAQNEAKPDNKDK